MSPCLSPSTAAAYFACVLRADGTATPHFTTPADPLQQQALAAAILGQDIANSRNQQQLYLQQMQNLKK
ncbi:Hypothetical protein FKW44_021925 [Caligus rogercresseyi]|uniref:Uncharacterized protein n=1 Tax=Caligus rogercresseyi TaxID=217165 RepID=A0A7T8GS17_CALRO|nr:Hypothetical protein FKW44_021925 [Caligus rogercresseyi]